MKEKGYLVSFNLKPIKDIPLRSKYDYEMAGNGNLTYLKYLGIAAFFILFIAWIKYINLSTARALDRAKEVAVRKVIGTAKRQLIMQFLTESLVVDFFAIAVGLAIYYLSLPSFSHLVEKHEKPGNTRPSFIGYCRHHLFFRCIFSRGPIHLLFYPPKLH